jgi:hypothetical protein
MGDLDITDSVRIVGNDMPVIDGNASDRVFDIHPGAQVEMSGLVVQNGQYVAGGASREGGGISNRGILTATGLLIRDNTGRGVGSNGGGGVYNGSGATAFISHSAILTNYSEEGAGGILNIGALTLDTVTISGNDAYGIFTIGPLDISYSTIADNEVVQIWMGAPAAAPVIGNSIIAGFPDHAGCFGIDPMSDGFNLEYIELDSDRSCNMTGPNDLTGVDPLLLPLSAYDGVSPPFHALDPASPAIDSADPANCGGTDQRGVERPQGSACDRGAYESQELITLPDLPVATAPPEFEPPELTPFILNVAVPANCRQGPGIAYAVVNSAQAGEQVQVIGRNVESTWWYSQVDNDKCWISDVAGKPEGDPGQLPVIDAPPPPPPTAVEQDPDEQPTEEAEIDFDQDGYGVSVDCNDKDGKIHPGAFETPDDKVDSNCNGEDDQ